MGLRSHKTAEKETKFTSPNAISLSRGMGGVALGVGLALGNVDPLMATVGMGILGLSDMEGLAITLANRFPRVQQALRIIPSSFGRVLDPIMDRACGAAVFIGASVGGEIPSWQSAGVLSTQLITSGGGWVSLRRGEKPEATKPGSAAMLGIFVTGGADFMAATLGLPSLGHEIFADIGNVSAVGSMALGLASAAQLFEGKR